MEGEAGDFEDWEVLHHSDEIGSVNSSDTLEDARTSEAIDGHSEGIIRSNHFSVDSQSMVVETVAVADASEEGSVESDNPSWIDPGSETRFPRNVSGEFWPDFASDQSDDHKLGEFDYKHQFGFIENAKSQLGSEGIGEIGTECGHLEKLWSNSGGIGPISVEFGGFEHHTEMGTGDSANCPEGSELVEEDDGGEVTSSVEGSVATGAVKPSGGEEKKSVVWWKVPFEFLKYYAFRVSPIWTFSVVAAVMGFVILRRRLYKMKQKSQRMHLKVTMDDKKVSQFMSRAARLNEAFSVVKRVPVIRPSLPVAGVTPWPVISLR